MANTSEFTAQFMRFQPLLNGHSVPRIYSDRGFWDSVGTHELDVELTSLADFYEVSNGIQRRSLRSELDSSASWNLVAYVRRMSLQIVATEDESWLTRALNIACLENATFGIPDSIVSLVIARAAAESVSLETLPHFDDAISECDSRMVSVLTNARDHLASDVRDLLREFGPPQLKPKRSAN